ncbi:MAG: hypothetical protein EI684_05960 [Candidatus Viridilinea halotolerans]|uniref:Gingipain domain-containing protein n=1 Tax=Candidatus Viridilinea halotolerans TaxID=2491704 RepID=A0A426U4T8_9CHLR|nr:MAG: hypothetical protein EI684_05960 [Candidatus Viridilinea halotolerans]
MADRDSHQSQLARLRDQVQSIQILAEQVARDLDQFITQQNMPALQPDRVWNADHLPSLIRGGGTAAEQQARPINGIDPRSGNYLLTLDAPYGSELAQARPDSSALHLLHLAKKRTKIPILGTVDGIDDNDLAASRWAVVVSAHDSCRLLKELTPLIMHRAQQQGITLNPAHLCFRDGETCGAWYARSNRHPRHHKAHWHTLPPVMIYPVREEVPQAANVWASHYGAAQGPVKPSEGVPFYLMLAGRPGPLFSGDQAYIPYEFQYQLDIFWAVGRVCFTDATGRHDWEAYTRYAERVIQFEQQNDAARYPRREIAYFGTKHPDDLPTHESAQQLITPLAATCHDDPNSGAGRFGFSQRLFLGDGAPVRYQEQSVQPVGSASRANLGTILTGNDDGRPPAILMLATHGAGLQEGTTADYLAWQGALLCQEWGGEGDNRREHWFTAADLDTSTRVEGMVAILFACYGAGSPHEDQFVFTDGIERPPQVAPFPMVARLPQQLLLHGSLAVLGHVDRAWNYSFQGPERIPRQTQSFEDILSLIAKGKRLGAATDQFNMVQAAHAASLVELLQKIKDGNQEITPSDVTNYWKARNDARNYALIGDPAVRLPFNHDQGV